MTTPEGATKTPRRFTRRTTAVSIGVAALLVGSGLSLGFTSVAQEQERAAQAQAAAASAAETRKATAEARSQLSEKYLSAQTLAGSINGVLGASGSLINDGAPTLGAAWATRLTAQSAAITALADAGIAEDLELPSLRGKLRAIDIQFAEVQTSLKMLVAAEVAAADGKMAAAARADQPLKDGVNTARQELLDAGLDQAHVPGSGVVERFAALAANVGSAEQSHAAVLAAEAAAAAAAAQAAADAAARANSGPRKASGGGYSSGGRATGGGGGGRASGGTSSGGGGGASAGGGAVSGGGSASGGGAASPGAAPAPSGGYTNEDARNAVVNKTGAVPKYGRCVKANYGTWGKTSSPPPASASGTLGYEAGALPDGSGGWVTYYSCD